VRAARPQRSEVTLSTVALDNAHLRLAWAPVANAASYAVYRNGLPIGSTTARTFSDAMLWPVTSYTYTVDAYSSRGARLRTLTASGATLPLPASGFPRPFASTSVWKTPIGNAHVASDSASRMAYFLAHISNPNMALRAWTVSVAEARPGDESYTVPCTVYSCTLGAFGAFPIPATAAPDPSADGSLAVYDPASGHEWDMWIAGRTSTGWTAAAGAALSSSGSGIVPAGTASGDAANFALLGGLIRPEEILQGHIDHPLVFSMPGVSRLGNVCPATHHDGSSTDPNALKEGTLLQLDPAVAVDLLAIPSWEKTIARAMQEYGMYLRDQGGSLEIYAENSVSRGYDAWANVGLGGTTAVGLNGIPWNRFRVLSPPC
jgi:hypothetical protein